MVASGFEWLAGALMFALGAAFGSFLNVVVYRIPAGMSLLYPPSRCPTCRHRLGLTENVPILGWLRLRGRCAHCQQPISPRYPLVEAAGGVLFVLAFWRFGLSPYAAGIALFLCWLLALSLIDLDIMELPEPLTKAGVIGGLGFQTGLGLLAGGGAGAALHLLQGVLGAVLGLWAWNLVTRAGTIALGQEAMGGGDAKLAAGIGAWLGWKLMLLAGFFGCLTGSAVGIPAIATGRMGRRDPMPFGPFLALGAAISALWGEALVAAYLGLFP